MPKAAGVAGGPCVGVVFKDDDRAPDSRIPAAVHVRLGVVAANRLAISSPTRLEE